MIPRSQTPGPYRHPTTINPVTNTPAKARHPHTRHCTGARPYSNSMCVPDSTTLSPDSFFNSLLSIPHSLFPSHIPQPPHPPPPILLIRILHHLKPQPSLQLHRPRIPHLRPAHQPRQLQLPKRIFNPPPTSLRRIPLPPILPP